MGNNKKNKRLFKLLCTSLALLFGSLIFGIFFSRVGDLQTAGTGLNLPLVWFELLIVASICKYKETKK